MNNARQLLLNSKVRQENKKFHQFKAYNTLEPSFLEGLKDSYSIPGDLPSMRRAKSVLLELYLSIATDFDPQLLLLINCFE